MPGWMVEPMTAHQANLGRRKMNAVTKETHLVRCRLIGNARRTAINRLIEAHTDLFQEFYAEECATRGISIRRGRVFSD